MIRRTITLPDDLAAAIEAAVAEGAAPNVSRFLQEAARQYLRARRDEHLAAEAARLDPDEEVALAGHRTPDGGNSPWRRLR